MPVTFIFTYEKETIMDILFIGITIVLFVASWFFMKLVDRV
jgi:hypothetical protein